MNKFLLAAWFAFTVWEAGLAGVALWRSRNVEPAAIEIEGAGEFVHPAGGFVLHNTVNFHAIGTFTFVAMDGEHGDAWSIDGKTLTQLADEGRAERRGDRIIYTYTADVDDE